MTDEAQITVRNAGLMLVQQAAHVVAGLVFAALVPRLMGPSVYGRYTLVVSLYTWFVLLSGLGLTQVLSRYVPEFTARQDRRGLQELFENLLTARVISSAVAASLYLAFTALWLRDVDPLVLAIAACAAFVWGVVHPVFALFLGLNRAARWGMRDILHRWVSLAFLLPGFCLLGLRGALFGLLFTNVAVLCIGLWWARHYISWPRLHLRAQYVAPYVRFGLSFFASSLLGTAYSYSGQMLVRAVSANYEQVAYFGLSHRLYTTGAGALHLLTLAFAPLLVVLLAQGDFQAIRRWIERLLKWLAAAGVLIVYGVLILAEDVVPSVLGLAYSSVAVNLLPLGLALLVGALGSIAYLLALTHDRPGPAVAASALRLVVFWVVGLPLVTRLGSLGACLAVLVARLLHSVYLTWRMRRVVSYSVLSWGLPVGIGLLFLPFVWLRSSGVANLVLYATLALGYGSALLLLKVVTPDEVSAAWRAIRSRSQSPPTSVGEH